MPTLFYPPVDELFRLGNWIIGPEFQQADPFINGVAAVVRDGRRVYIDKTGTTIWKQDRQPAGGAYVLPRAGKTSAHP